MSKTCVCKKFNDQQKAEFKKTIQKALKVLNKKNFYMIIHGASFPSDKNRDTGFGTYNSENAKKFIEFANTFGFNGIQLGPDGKTKAVDSSPYTATLFSNNPMFIDLYQLTTEEFGEILTEEACRKIANGNPATSNNTAYEYAYKEYNKALREAFRNYKSKLAQKDKKTKQLNRKFNTFVENNALWLEKDAVYEALSVKHGNDYWPVWQDELDKKLYCPGHQFTQEQADQRMLEIKEKFAEEIEFYRFVQFIAYVQKQNTKKYLKKKGMKTVADAQVAFSDRDFWANQYYFLENYYLGCPPDFFAEDGQAWGFPVLDPDKVFNPDGTLADGGKILKARFEKMFEENPGGVRIDHIIGLVDPYVYKKDHRPKPEEGAARLYSSPEHGELGKYAIVTHENLNHEFTPDNEHRIKNLSDDQVKQYARILEQIVIQSAQEKGIEKEAIICEDLGTVTNPVLEVMDKLELSGLRVTEFVDPEAENHPYRVKNTAKIHWVMIGSHDNAPLTCWLDELYGQNKIGLHARNLAEDLKPSQVEEFKQGLIENRSKFITAKFAELFASSAENIQVFFADFFGMKQRYNQPGTSGDQNWSLRVPNNYECFYYDQLAGGEALNLPEALIMAIESRGSSFASKQKTLISKLQSYAEIISRR